ncbi:MAG: acyloxyacyl hydrolase [Gemmatimonadota bacterium]|nr:acyloxyacyl hydrolase [Gemmatimonadota bacterium]
MSARATIAVVVAVAVAFPAAAQEATREHRGLEVWGGLASNSPRWGLLGASPEMNLGILAVRISHPLGWHANAAEGARFEYTFDLVPVALLSRPYTSARGLGVPCPGADLCVLPQDDGGRLFPSGSAYGFGFNPAGITARFRRARTVAPTVGMAVGALFFDRRVPTTRATRFNFTASGEAGLRIGGPDRPAVTLTYRFHHLSNAGTSRENPGVASHLLTVGFHFRR